MKKKTTVLVLATSAPHFPVKAAKRTYSDCVRTLKKRLDFDFIGSSRVITDTASFADELNKLKSGDPDALILIQGAFTWDNIAVGAHEYLGKIPTLLWAIPEKDFSSGVLEANSLCGAIMNNAALHKLKADNRFCYGRCEDDKVTKEIGDLLKNMTAKKRRRASKAGNLRYGMVGYRPTGFYNSTFDEMRIRKHFGIEAVYYDVVSLFEDIARIPHSRVKKDTGLIRKMGKIGRASGGSLERSSRVYLALKDFIHKERIDFLGVRCWPEMMNKGMNPCMVLGRLTDEGIAASCEADFGGALSMAIAKQVSGSTSWLADLIDVSGDKRSFYFWHCGAAPGSLCHEKESPVINRQFRGGDRGNTLEFALKEGAVTVLRFGITDDRYRIFAFEGSAVSPDIRLRGNTSQVIPDNDPQRVLEKIIECGVEHHMAVVYGRHIKALKKLAKEMKVDFYAG
ncbi:L-fucose/L-arabinose isomerase family protein [Candidatus Omnitrophota bacterium]